MSDHYYPNHSLGVPAGNPSMEHAGATGPISPGATPSAWPPSPMMPGPSMPQGIGHIPLHDAHQYGAQAAPTLTETGTYGPPSVFWLNFRDQQFWKGALLGAAITLLVTNETLQKGVMKGAAKLYSVAQGGVQEIKEKFEDVKAELRQKTQEK